MKKKILAVLMSVVVVLSAISGIAVYAANTTLDFTPNTPIEFHDMRKFLFMEKEFSTRVHPEHPVYTDDWKYYYWCDFKPQYEADYSFSIRSQFRMKCEIYDDANNLLAVGNSDTAKGEDKLYHLSLTYRLETGKQYYFKYAFTEGNYDTVGKFWVYFSSNGSDKIESAESLHLYINDSSSAHIYELKDYSVPQLFLDLTFIVIYKDGSFSKWVSRDNPAPQALDGVDILLNSSDCRAEVGRHTLVAHYHGYEVKASFDIVECIHQYKLDSIEYPLWKQQGSIAYKCEKCGETYSESTSTAEELKPLVEAGLNTKKGDADFNEAADVNRDNAINARDVAIILKAYNAYETPTKMKGEGVSQSFE